MRALSRRVGKLEERTPKPGAVYSVRVEDGPDIASARSAALAAQGVHPTADDLVITRIIVRP